MKQISIDFKLYQEEIQEAYTKGLLQHQDAYHELTVINTKLVMLLDTYSSHDHRNLIKELTLLLERIKII